MTLPPVCGVGLKMIVLLAAGVGVSVLGLLAIGFGIPISDTSFGNALLIAGVVILCTGVILIGMWLAAREMVNAARLIVAQGAQPAKAVASPRPPALASPFAVAIGEAVAERPDVGDGISDRLAASASPPPWADEIATRAKPRPSAPEIPAVEPRDVQAAPAPAPDRPARRNLLFSAKRRDTVEPAPPATAPPLSTTALEAEPKVSFENAWPNPSRANGSAGRSESSLSTAEAASSETDAGRSSAAQSEPAKADLPDGVTVIKSGVVDGMAYTLYSDGSIEAQLPGEGPIRFASLDALRTYVEQRQ
jgi:hypothetical protein